LAGRPVLAVVGAAEVDQSVGASWERLLLDPQQAAAASLARTIVQRGGVAQSREVMAQESWAARKALQGVAPSPYRRGMERLASGLAARSSAA
jgi:hypothetical protein